MAVIEVDGVQFGVRSVADSIELLDDSPGFPGLLLVVKKLIDSKVGSTPIEGGEWVVVPQWATGRPAVSEAVEVIANGFLNWMRLTGGRRADPRSAYLCNTPFDEHDLLVPTATLVELIHRIEALRGHPIDAAVPVRAAPPPEVVEWDRLRASAPDEAAAYAVGIVNAEPWNTVRA